ncbi:MAG: HAMP domain-containing protein [Proteobacteria bacterium]|nr:HAMP domain-containing protein [Pseudomonadota bacterium]
MKFGITSRLFVAVALTNVAVAAAAMLAAYLSFSLGFLDYLKEREGDRLEGLASELAARYKATGGWAFVAHNEARWAELNRVYVRGGLPRELMRDLPLGAPPAVAPGPGDPPADDRGVPRNLALPSAPEGAAMPPPPNVTRPSLANPPTRLAAAGPTDGTSTDAMPPRLPPIEGPFPRGMDAGLTTLLDADKHVIAGPKPAANQAVLRPVVADGRTIGWLAGAYLRGPLTGADQRFESHQREAAVLIFGLGLTLAALLAWLMARGFVAPIKRLAHATHELAGGRYGTRVAAAPSTELGQLVDDFNRLAATLERNETLRRHWMADVSHELRTPLAVLRGELEAIEDGVRDMTPATLASLQTEVATLSKLVDDLHEVSLAEVGGITLHREPVDVGALVAGAVHVFAPRLAARGITARASDERGAARERQRVEADVVRVTQVLNNLLENCVRYTRTNGHVLATVRAVDGAVAVTVADDGPGVPPDALPRLFERLYRVESSRNRATGGSGIGLALCRGLVETHGGTITAAPSRDGGLAVTFTLPVTSPG